MSRACITLLRMYVIYSRYHSEIKKTLDRAQQCGVTGVLIIRGGVCDVVVILLDFPLTPDIDLVMDFKHADELVKFVREEYGNTFTIAVAGVCGACDSHAAGYPDVHPEAKDMDDDIQFLKNKVDAGADFVITQVMFNLVVVTKVFLRR